MLTAHFEALQSMRAPTPESLREMRREGCQDAQSLKETLGENNRVARVKLCSILRQVVLSSARAIESGSDRIATVSVPGAVATGS